MNDVLKVSIDAAQRKAIALPGYWEDITKAASSIDETHVYLSRENYQRIRDKYAVPSLVAKAKHFVSSAARHAATGMPRASDDEVARRFAICQTCEHYDGKACRKCGCPIVRQKQFVSKLSWAGESCPAGKWGPAS